MVLFIYFNTLIKRSNNNNFITNSIERLSILVQVLIALFIIFSTNWKVSLIFIRTIYCKFFIAYNVLCLNLLKMMIIILFIVQEQSGLIFI